MIRIPQLHSMVTSYRKTPLAYYRLRANSEKTFAGLGVRQSQQFTRSCCKRGYLEGEPVYIPKKTPEIKVRWALEGVESKSVPVAMSRIELSGPDRLKAAAPTLNHAQLVWIAGTDDWAMKNWATLDEIADRWDRGNQNLMAIDGMDVHELRLDTRLSDLQRYLISEQFRKRDRLISSTDLARAWLETYSAKSDLS